MSQTWVKVRRSWLAIPAIIASVLLLTQYLVSAATGQIYISPNSATVANGANTTLSVRINPGTAVDGVTGVRLSWDSTKLEYVSVDSGGTAFEAELSQAVATGSVTQDRATFGSSVTSDALIYRVTLRAKVGSGNTTISVSGNAAGSGGFTDPAGDTATINFTGDTPPPPPPPPPTTPPPPPTTPPPPPPTTPPPTTPPPPPTTPPPPPPTTPPPPPPTQSGPTITVTTGNVSYTSAVIHVESSVPVKAWVKYGLSGDFSLTTPATDLGTSHDISLSEAHLIAGRDYNFIVVVQDEAGVVTESKTYTVRTKGFTLRIRLLTKGGKALRNSTVTLNSDPQTGKTDKDGYVTFENVAPGEHTINYQHGGKTYSRAVFVEDLRGSIAEGVEPATQNVSVTYDELTISDFSLVWLIVGLAVGAGIVFVFYTVRRSKGGLGGFGGMGGGSTKVVSGDGGAAIDSNEPLINRVSGVKPDNPGTVIAPNKKSGE